MVALLLLVIGVVIGNWMCKQGYQVTVRLDRPAPPADEYIDVPR